jgi:2'-5' RNA ligase
MYKVPASALQPGLERIRHDLAEVAGLRLHPDHFLHVSLQELGFVKDGPTRVDEITPAALEELVTNAVGPISERAPFTVRLGGANSFQDAPFLEVHDDGHSSRIHQRLFDVLINQRPSEFAYLPHVTLGHYTAPGPATTAIDILSNWRSTHFGEFEVKEIEIATLSTDESYPAFQPFAIFPLNG